MKLFLKYVFILAAAAGLGLLAGWGYQKYEATTVSENFFSDQWSSTSGSTNRPIVSVVGGTRIDLGEIANDETTKREFIFQNDGTALLEVWVETPVTKHFGVDLNRVREDIAVGETKVVTVFISKDAVENADDQGKIFGEIAVRTSDPTTPKVLIEVTAIMKPNSDQTADDQE